MITYNTKHGTVSTFAQEVARNLNERIPYGGVIAQPEDCHERNRIIITWYALVNDDYVTAQVRLRDDTNSLIHTFGSNPTPDYVASRILVDLSKRVGEAITGQHIV